MQPSQMYICMLHNCIDLTNNFLIMLILGSNLFTESVNEVYKVTELHYILNVGIYLLCS